MVSIGGLLSPLANDPPLQKNIYIIIRGLTIDIVFIVFWLVFVFFFFSGIL